MVNQWVHWFSGPQETIEAAQEFYAYDLLDPAAIFELPNEGGFVLAYIRDLNFPPHETAKQVEHLIGYKMVSYCTFSGIWHPYQKET